MFLVSLKQFVSSMAGKKFQVWPTRVLDDEHCHLRKGPNSCSKRSLSHPVSSKLFAAGLLGECSKQPKMPWFYLCSYWVKKEWKHCVWKEVFLLRHWFFLFFFFILLKKKAASSWTEIFLYSLLSSPTKKIYYFHCATSNLSISFKVGLHNLLSKEPWHQDLSNSQGQNLTIFEYTYNTHRFA